MTRQPDLRPYQQDVVTAVMRDLETPGKSMVHSPTGSGKSVMIKSIVSQLPEMQTLIIVPRINLLQQMQRRFSDLNPGILSASLGRDDGSKHHCLLATFQTLLKQEITAPTLVIIDECHLVGLKSAFDKRIRELKNCKIVGFTATPTRGHELIEYQGWKKVHEVKMLDLIRDGFLVPPVSIATNGTIYSVGKDDVKVTEEIVGNLHAQILAEKRNKPVVFCKRIKQAELVAKKLAELGEENIYLVHSKREKNAESDMQTYAQFEHNPDRSWLINVNKVNIGVDIPCIDAVAILRDIKHFAPLAQMIGRGLRPFLGKKDCLVFDFGKGTERFGFLDDPIFPQRRDKAKRLGLELIHTCPCCGRQMYFDAERCPGCNLDSQQSADTSIKRTSNLNPNSIQVDLLSSPEVALTLGLLTIDTVTISPAEDGKVYEALYSFKENSQYHASSFHSGKPAKLPRTGQKVRTERVRGDFFRILSL